MTLVAAESGGEPPGGDATGEVEPEVGAGEVEDPETTLICTFWPAEQWPVNPQMKYLDPTSVRVTMVLPSVCVEIGLEVVHESKFACVTSSTLCSDGL